MLSVKVFVPKYMVQNEMIKLWGLKGNSTEILDSLKSLV